MKIPVPHLTTLQSCSTRQNIHRDAWAGADVIGQFYQKAIKSRILNAREHVLSVFNAPSPLLCIVLFINIYTCWHSSSTFGNSFMHAEAMINRPDVGETHHH